MPKNEKKYSELLNPPMRPDLEEDRRQSLGRVFKKEDQFLDKISQLESSGGSDVDHPMMTHGIHKDQRAIGEYGLMPNTIQEVVNRSSMQGDPTLEPLKGMSDEEVEQAISINPDLEQNLARKLARHVLQRQLGNESKSAYAWQMGHNKRPEDISQEQLNSSDYVNKFNRLKKKMSNRK